MVRKLPEITETELAVLQALWDRGPASVRQLVDALYPGGKASEYGTVHKLLERLEAKGHVRRRKDAGGYVFRAAVDREALISRGLDALAEKLCGGSVAPLLSHLVRGRRLSAEEVQELLDLIDALDSPTKSRKSRK